ncbi:3-deoxy-manno-octulosonate cytidylyltransferase [bacterium]|nr:3-deoxy-manno-octulosonate cytidylyltransferase [bacterium]
MRVLAVIPARYTSRRFPGKPLATVAGRPLVQHVWERCRESEGVERIVIATDDERIRKACLGFGAETELTNPDHASGTDRVAEISRRYPEYDVVLNVQGDEPGIAPSTITAVARAFRVSERQITTAVSPIRDETDKGNPNVVKVVTARDGDALYFSRAAIPFRRTDSSGPPPVFYRHQGIYGFQRDVLQQVTTLPVTDLERAESLEQLRWLENGFRIHCIVVSQCAVGVDTPADVPIVEHLLQAKGE